MSNNAASPRFQPRADETRRLVNGEFYAKRDKIFRAPIETKTEGGTNISVGFPVCHVSDYVDADNLVECLNASREVDGLKARVEELEREGKEADKYFDLAGEFGNRAMAAEARVQEMTQALEAAEQGAHVGDVLANYRAIRRAALESKP